VRRPPWIDRWAPAAALAVLWVASRIGMVWIWRTRSWTIVGDVYYYAASVGSIGRLGLSEYPSPLAWLLLVLTWLAGGDPTRFLHLFVALMVLLDLITTVMLWRLTTRRSAVYWTVFLALIGPLVWCRIDLIPACLVTWTLVLARRAPGTSGVALALGAGAKFWPALLLGPLLGGRGEAVARARGFLLIGAALGITSLVVTGWTRSVSPLVWQSDRGLQIESVSATWLMWRHTSSPNITVSYTRHLAFELSGPSVAGWLNVSAVLMAAAIALAGALAWLVAWSGVGLRGHSAATRRLPERSGDLAWIQVLGALAITSAIIVANKSFSPQYLMWLAGPLALLAGHTTHPGRRVAVLGWCLLGWATALLTQVVYPLGYDGLIANPGDAGVTACLIARNTGMVVLAASTTIAALAGAINLGRVGEPGKLTREPGGAPRPGPREA